MYSQQEPYPCAENDEVYFAYFKFLKVDFLLSLYFAFGNYFYILFYLSVSEQLRFFAALKGIRDEQLDKVFSPTIILHKNFFNVPFSAVMGLKIF
uniref:Uncharacterized protein n=1 Tax=Heterorhabditis bacteriophora TaxID=37862 RepID=A0A1I7WXM1_HETBA